MILIIFIILSCLLSFLYWLVQRECAKARHIRRDMSVITRLSEMALSVKQKAKLYQDIVDLCRESAGCDRAAMVFYNENGHNLHVVAVSGARKMAEERVFGIGEGLAGKVYISRKATYIPNVKSCPDHVPAPVQGTAEDDSMLLLPLMYQTQCIGILCFMSGHQKKIRHDHFITETLANMVSRVAASALPDRDSNIVTSGLYKTWYFEQQMGKAIKQFQRRKEQFGILIISLKNIHEINTTHGHDAGSDVMKEFAVGLLRLLRETDILASYKNGKFVILCTGVKSGEMKFVAERFYKSVVRKIKEIDLELSFLYIHYPTDTMEASAVVLNKILNEKVAEINTMDSGFYNYASKKILTLILVFLLAAQSMFAASFALSTGGVLKNISGVSLRNVKIDPIGEGAPIFIGTVIPDQSINTPFGQFLVEYTFINTGTGKPITKKDRFTNKGFAGGRGASSSSGNSSFSEKGGIRRLAIDYNTEGSFWLDPKTYILKVAAADSCKVTVLDTFQKASEETDGSTGDSIKYIHEPTEEIICLGLATKDVDPSRPAIYFLEPQQEKPFYTIYFELERNGDRRLGRQTIKPPVFVNEGGK